MLCTANKNWKQATCLPSNPCKKYTHCGHTCTHRDTGLPKRLATYHDRNLQLSFGTRIRKNCPHDIHYKGHDADNEEIDIVIAVCLVVVILEVHLIFSQILSSFSGLCCTIIIIGLGFVILEVSCFQISQVLDGDRKGQDEQEEGELRRNRNNRYLLLEKKYGC